MHFRTVISDMSSYWASCRLVTIAVALSLLAMSSAAQPVIDFVDEADFDRPEVWGMKFFSSVGAMTSMGAIVARDPGSIELGLEGIQIPHLDQEQRTIGFDGTKEEELNRSPGAARVRATLGLPGKLSLVLGAAPPVRVDGVRAELYSLALERPLFEGDRLGLGVRVVALAGTVDGDLTCSEQDASIPPFQPGNEFACEAPSDDEGQLDHYGAGLVASYRVTDRTKLHLGLNVQEMDLEFQVNALTGGVLDRTLILSDGSTWSVNAGAAYDRWERFGVSVEAFYSPLDIERPGQDTENDALFNVRGMLRYKLR